jgi:hypothetical protein
MFAFTSPLVEPLLLLFFGLVFLVVATGLQIRLTRKQEPEQQEAKLLGSESGSMSSMSSMSGTLQSR